MTRPVPVARPAALRAAVGRAWLLAGVLALIAGLLGMHVMTSGHASHGAPAGQAAVAHSAGSAQAGHSHGATDMPELSTAACGDSCPGAQEAGVPCIPTAPSGPADATIASLNWRRISVNWFSRPGSAAPYCVEYFVPVEIPRNDDFFFTSE